MGEDPVQSASHFGHDIHFPLLHGMHYEDHCPHLQRLLAVETKSIRHASHHPWCRLGRSSLRSSIDTGEF